MAQGTSAGGVCYPTQLQAAQAWCGDVNVSTSSGLMSCQGIVSGASDSAGGIAQFTWQQRITPPTGNPVQRNINLQALPACESFDFDYYQPAIAAGIALLVAVWAAKRLARFFDLQTA